jgi:DNA-binding beta-propeller fold protein YncE
LTNDVSIFDLGGQATLHSIPLYTIGITIVPVQVNPFTHRVYTSFKMIDLTTEAVSNHSCGGDEIAVNEHTGMLYFGDAAPYIGQPDTVCVLDGGNNSRVTTINIGTSHFYEDVDVAMDPNANLLYVSYTGSDTLLVFDGTTNTLVNNVVIPDIGDVVVNPLTNRIYVSSGTAKTLVLDGSTLTSVGEISAYSNRMILNPLTDRIYFLSLTSLKIADGATNLVVATMPLESGSYGSPGLDQLRGRLYFMGTNAGWKDRVIVVQDLAPELPGPIYLPLTVR